jgi:hypothetical protein
MRFHRLLLCLVVLAGPALLAAAEAPKGAPVEIQIYDVNNLTYEAPDYPGPELMVMSPPVNTGNTAVAEVKAAASTPASIADMIRNRIRPETWDVALGTSIEEMGGYLVVSQTPEIHALITNLLAAFNGTAKLIVSTKGLLIPATTVPDGTYYSEEELNKLFGGNAAATATVTPSVSGFNKQRVHTLSGTTHAVVKDLDVNGDSYDPVVGTVLDGFVFDVRPTVSSDRTLTNVELRATFNSNLKRETRALGAQAERGVRSVGVLPPGESSSTSTKKEESTSSSSREPGSLLSTQYTAGIELDFPFVDSNAVRTEVSVPAGKWVLAAVLSNPDSKAANKHMLLFISSEVTEVH